MQHTPEAVENKIRSIIARTLKIDTNKFGPDTQLVDELGADSLDAISIALDVDEEFGIHVDDQELKNFNTCHEIVSAVLRHLNIPVTRAGAAQSA